MSTRIRTDGSCDRYPLKVGYPTVAEAAAAAKLIQDGHELRASYCPVCGTWHLLREDERHSEIKTPHV